MMGSDHFLDLPTEQSQFLREQLQGGGLEPPERLGGPLYPFKKLFVGIGSLQGSQEAPDCPLAVALPGTGCTWWGGPQSGHVQCTGRTRIGREKKRNS